MSKKSIAEDLRYIEKLIRHLLLSRGYDVEPSEPEVLEVCAGSWKVALTFTVKKK